jgi:hypothetical protein
VDRGSAAVTIGRGRRRCRQRGGRRPSCGQGMPARAYLLGWRPPCSQRSRPQAPGHPPPTHTRHRLAEAHPEHGVQGPHGMVSARLAGWATPRHKNNRAERVHGRACRTCFTSSVRLATRSVIRFVDSTTQTQTQRQAQQSRLAAAALGASARAGGTRGSDSQSCASQSCDS